MIDLDLVCVGDAVLDIFLTINNEKEFFRLDKPSGNLILRSGEKILVDEASFKLGGNACNVSVGTKRLGLRSGLIAEFGGDEFAEKLKKGLNKEGVNLDNCKTTKDSQSTFSVGLHIAGERTLFVCHVEREHEMNFKNLTSKWVYLTSVGKKWENLYKNAFDFVNKCGAGLAFNPGSTQLKEGVEKFKYILESTDILLVNKEEAEQILYGKVQSPEKRENPEDILFRIQRMGPKIICMTDGENGSIAVDSEGKFYKEGVVKPLAYIGKTGAGDSFASGFLSAIIYGKNITEAMHWGSVNAAGVLEHIGSQTGLLTLEDLEKRISA